MSENQNRLEQYFFNNQDRLIHKWNHYFDIYERHFSQYVGKEIVILEIGVFHGGSLKMWKDYFGPKAKIYGVDINPRCKDLEEDQIEIFIGSQSDKSFLNDLKSKIPKIDILIDDGGHTMRQQITTFNSLYDHIKDDGVYLCEDVHTSYQIAYGGGYKRSNTFIEFSKQLIDSLHAFHSEQSSFKKSDFTSSTNAIHFYDSIVVFEKTKRNSPVDLKSGNPSFDTDGFEESGWQKIKRKIKVPVNHMLRTFRLPAI